ncbi:MAG: helix-turn-helix domain-containing protein [Methanomassiliicoccales archaeon]
MNILEILKLDIQSLENEYKKIAATLEKIGLSDYESRALVTLIARNHGTADEISDLSGIPRTSSYKALNSLCEKGLANSTSGRPIIYHPIQLDEIRKKVIAELEDVFEKLEAIRGTLSEKGTPQLVYTIAGKRGVLGKIGEMLDASVHNFIISTPAIHEVRNEHAQRFKDAVGRGVEVIIITEPLLKPPKCTKLYRKKDLLATDVLCDSKEAIIAAPDLSLCGYSDNPFIASHLENFMRIVIDRLESSKD